MRWVTPALFVDSFNLFCVRQSFKNVDKLVYNVPECEIFCLNYIVSHNIMLNQIKEQG